MNHTAKSFLACVGIDNSCDSFLFQLLLACYLDVDRVERLVVATDAEFVEISSILFELSRSRHSVV
jgi:hypothetical protein